MEDQINGEEQPEEEGEEEGEEKPEEEGVQEFHLESIQKELKEHKDKYLRLLAEMENTRKRMQKEKHDTTRFAVENVVTEFFSSIR